MKLTPFDIQKILSSLPEGAGVSIEDKADWLDNPCTALFMYACIELMRDVFAAHLGAKNMYDVCEQRGAYHACVSALSIPSQIPVVQAIGLDREQSGAFKRRIEEMLDGIRDRDDDERDRAGDGDDD